MFARRLVTQLAGTIAQRLWLLVLPLAMLTTACAGLIGSTSKPATVDTTPPTVSITSPTPAATVSGTITVTANASDKVPVASVQFQVDGSNFGALDASAPYSASLNTGTLTNGKHSLTAVAIDTAGNKATSSAVSITVNNTDTTPPSVSITSPASGATVSGTITVTANASDSVAIASVQFQVDGSNFGALNTSVPYSASLSTGTLTNGKHSLTAVAIDTAGNKATSSVVSVTVNNTGNTTPPTVSVTSPASGATVSGTITVTANAADSVAVASVQFQVNGSNLGAAVTSAPYSASLNTTTLTNGAHTLTAIATDTSNNKTTSAGVSITVNNPNLTPVTVSITSPISGATLSGTVTVTANASAGAGVASVQFLLDGANLSSADASSPYAVLWDTTTVSNGSHTLAAKATDKSGNTATSSNVVVNISQSTTPPPAPAGDEVTITDGSGLGQTNRPVSISRPFVQGEIANFAQASIGGTALLTQCDVKNRWPDGSLKFAVVSFVIPSIATNGSVVVSFSNQASGNNTGFLTPSDLLNSSYNFDAQIRLTGTANHNISARTILSAASNCGAPSNGDIDGFIGTSGNLCTYWLQGPIVTAVILEDRAGRSYDVNTDGGTGNPLHPRFEAWFYPQTNQVVVGYTLEDDWASTTAASSARDQTYATFVLTGGNSSPVTEFNNYGTGFTQRTRTMVHKTFCINGTGAGTANNCYGSALHVDNGWPYLAQTKLWPNWDASLQISPTKIASEAAVLSNTAALNFAGCTSCVQGSTGIFYFPGGIDAGGADEAHGPLTTWDIIYLMTQCDPGSSTSSSCGDGLVGDMYSTMLAGADTGGIVPYWFREADASAGHGLYFDANASSVGTVATQGRVVSINARTQINLFQTQDNVGQCPTDYTADWINYGGTGEDLSYWSDQTDTSHWPNMAYSSYLTTGQYAYYEEQLMQAANAIGNSPGFIGCGHNTNDSAWRQGALGYVTYGDGERSADWALREMMLGATVALDSSPEQNYFTDKLRVNLAVFEGSHNIPCDIPGTGVQQPYCGSTSATAWGWGNIVRAGNPFAGTALGQFTTGVCSGGALNCYVPNAPLCQVASGCTVPGGANANFMADYGGFVLGWLNDLGFCPQTGGKCQLRSFVDNWYINVVEDPNASMFLLGDYVFPTLNSSNTGFTAWSQVGPYFSSGSWPRTSWGGGSSLCGDEGYGAEGVANIAYAYKATSNEGFSGASAYNAARPSLLAACTSGNVTFGNASGSPKWDIVPRP